LGRGIVRRQSATFSPFGTPREEDAERAREKKENIFTVPASFQAEGQSEFLCFLFVPATSGSCTAFVHRKGSNPCGRVIRIDERTQCGSLSTAWIAM
jgi:hypothetical protein